MITKDIAKLLEQGMIRAVADNLEKYITVTDFGITLNSENEQVYRTHLLVKINAVQETPVDRCRNSGNPVGERKVSDRERLEILASELLGVCK